MRLFLMGLCLSLFSASAWGQASVVPGNADEEAASGRHEHSVNFGAKVGFTSSLFLVSRFSVNGTPIDEVQNNYKIGYFGSLFMRINFDRHFLQPEISYNVNRCNITFEKPQPEDAVSGTLSEEASITSSIHSIDIPVLYGYNIIKEGPYSLAVFGGPKVRYIWDKKSDIDFKNFDQANIREELRPLNLSFTIGVAVTISRVFFDFRYDMGLHNISKHVTCDDNADTPAIRNAGTRADNGNEANKISFHRRDNVLSFSFGVFF